MSVLAHPVGVDPLIAEAKQRARRRRLLALAAAGILIAGVAGVELSRSGSSGGTSGAIPWLPTKPSLGAAHPPLAPLCTAAQLHASMYLVAAGGGQGGGQISLVNRSSKACALVGLPQLSLGDRRAVKSAPNARPPFPQFDPLAPPYGSLRALAPGGHVSVGLLVGRLGDACSPWDSVTRAKAVLAAPGGGAVHLGAIDPYFSPCNPGVLAQATRYTPVIPQGPRSSALPLRARIVTVPHLIINGARMDGRVLAVTPGSWLSYTVVLTNRSSRVFRFGRRCPAYTEGDGLALKAYVLNCHPVGAIAAGQSVRFAMRYRVPHDPGTLTWTLAPHSYNAPGDGVDLE